MKLAIVSPSNNSYSETFIHAHRLIDGAQVSFYFGGDMPTQLEGKGALLAPSLQRRVFNKLSGKSPSAKQAFADSLKEEGIQIVLAEYGMTGAAIFEVCSQLQIPLVVHFHGYDASVYDVVSKYGQAYGRMFEYASFVISVSKKMSEMLIDLGCPSDKLVYAPYGPNDAFLELQTNPAVGKHFLSIGRFVDKKAPYFTLLAFQKAKELGCQAKLILAGDGPLKNTCLNLAKYYGIQDDVIFPGIVKPEEYREYLKSTLAYVQHSMRAENGDMEGTPVAILEAGAAGVPVISTFHAGIPDVILDGVTGLLCKEGDVESMAANMIKLWNDREEAAKMGQRSKERVKSNFSLDKHLDSLSIALKKAFKHH